MERQLLEKDATLTQELEASLKQVRALEEKAKAAMESKELEEKARAAMESKELDLELIGQRKLQHEIMSSHQWEAAKKANITMQQAIQIAMSQQPGTVTQCRLISEQLAGERDQVFYILTIVSSDEPMTMLISAVDGRVVRTWKSKR